MSRFLCEPRLTTRCTQPNERRGARRPRTQSPALSLTKINWHTCRLKIRATPFQSAKVHKSIGTESTDRRPVPTTSVPPREDRNLSQLIDTPADQKSTLSPCPSTKLPKLIDTLSSGLQRTERRLLSINPQNNSRRSHTTPIGRLALPGGQPILGVTIRYRLSLQIGEFACGYLDRADDPR